MVRPAEECVPKGDVEQVQEMELVPAREQIAPLRR